MNTYQRRRNSRQWILGGHDGRRSSKFDKV